MSATTTAYATCPLCEATCGLEFQLSGNGAAEVLKIRGDEEDVFSRGFICPKGGSLKALHEDPDRLRAPLVRRDGELVEATWEEAFEEIDRRMTPILAWPLAIDGRKHHAACALFDSSGRLLCASQALWIELRQE